MKITKLAIFLFIYLFLTFFIFYIFAEQIEKISKTKSNIDKQIPTIRWDVLKIENVSESIKAWAGTSIAIDKKNRVHIVYMSSYYGNLKYAILNGNAWYKEQIPSAEYSCDYNSLALDSKDIPHICYYDRVTKKLKYIKKVSTNNWIAQIVDEDGVTGIGNSIKLDKNDNPCISYIDDSKKYLKYAKFTDSAWNIAIIDSNVTGLTSLSLDSKGYPHIVYCSKEILKLASWNGEKWEITKIDDNAVSKPAIAIDKQNNIYIVYPTRTYNPLSGALMLTKYSKGSLSRSTIFTRIDPPATSSICIDKNGNIHIVNIREKNVLSYITKVNETWNVQIIDKLDIFSQCNSMALDSEGNIHISYSDTATNSIKYAKGIRVIIMDPKIEEGIEFIKKKEYLKAIECFDNILQFNPNNESTLLNKAKALYELRNFWEARKNIDRAVEINPKLEDAWYYKGLIEIENSSYEEALKCFNKITELQPNNIFAWHHIGILLSHIGNYPEANKCFDKALQILEFNPKIDNDEISELPKLGQIRLLDNMVCQEKISLQSIRRHKLQTLYNTNSYEEIIKFTDKIVETEPNNFIFLCAKIDALRSLSRNEEAIILIDKALKNAPQDVALLYEKGLTLENIGKCDQALSCYNESIKIFSNNEIVWQSKIRVLTNMSNWEEILKTIEQYSKVYPQHYQSTFDVLKAKALRNLGKYKDAISVIDSVIKYNSLNSEVWAEKAYALEQSTMTKEAIKCLNKAISLGTNDYEVFYHKGLLLKKMGDIEQAKMCFEQVIKLNPNHKDAKDEIKQIEETNTITENIEVSTENKKMAENITIRGEQYLRTVKYKKALDCFNRAITLYPQYSRAWYLKGILLCRMKEYKEALDCCKKSVGFSSNDYKAWNAMGVIYNNLENYQSAIECFDKALQISSESVSAWYNKWTTFAKTKTIEGTMNCIEKVVELQPFEYWEWICKADAYLVLGKYNDALRCVDNALKENSREIYAWEEKGNILMEIGKYKDALKCYNEIVKLNPEYSYGFYNKGRALAHLKKKRAALKLLNIALDIDPNLSEAWASKGEVLIQLGKNEEGINCLDKATEIDPQNAFAWFKKGIIFYEQEDVSKYGSCFSNARELYRKEIELYPNDPYLWDNLSNTLGHLWVINEVWDCYSKAIQCYDEILKINPEYAYPLYLKAWFLNRNYGKIKEPISYLDKVLEIDLLYAEAWQLKGKLLYDLTDSRRTSADGPSEWFYIESAGEYMNSQVIPTLKEAEKCYNEAIKIYKRGNKPLSEISETEQSKNEITKKIEKYDRLAEETKQSIEKNPNDFKLIEQKADLFAYLGYFNEALKYYKKINKSVPTKRKSLEKKMILLSKKIDKYQNLSYKNSSLNDKYTKKIGLLRKKLNEYNELIYKLPNNKFVWKKRIKLLEKIAYKNEAEKCRYRATEEIWGKDHLGGIGASVVSYSDKTYTYHFTEPIPMSPADKAGIKKGDAILEVDGFLTSNLKRLNTTEVEEKIRGVPRTKVKIKIFRNNIGTIEEIELERIYQHAYDLYEENAL